MLTIDLGGVLICLKKFSYLSRRGEYRRTFLILVVPEGGIESPIRGFSILRFSLHGAYIMGG